jgi:hypothetical protein
MVKRILIGILAISVGITLVVCIETLIKSTTTKILISVIILGVIGALAWLKDAGQAVMRGESLDDDGSL